jgi:HlyD family secretion protein
MNMTLVLGAMQNEKISATLEYVYPEAVSSNGAKMFEIHASVHIPAGLNILNGYSVNANIELEKASQALSIDETAVEIDNGKTYVYKLTSPVEDTEDQTFERMAIEAGISDGIHIEVKNGITENMMLRGIKK